MHADSSTWFKPKIDKKYLNKRLLKYLDMEPVALAPWDPMGALAR